MPETVFDRNARLRDQLLLTLRSNAGPDLRARIDRSFGITTASSASPDPAAPVHVVVSYAEINRHHGTGVLVERVFRGRTGIFSIRFRDDWGIHDFGDWHVRLPLKSCSREESLRQARRLLMGRNVKTISCVPFSAAELETALAIQQYFGAKLCVWIMDDRNVSVHSIPDAIMRDCLAQCSLRLVTHPELRAAYQEKYGLPFHLLPAVVPASLVPKLPVESAWDGRTKRAAIIGSFWEQYWFDRLCDALEAGDWEIDWYGQNNSPWLNYPPEDLRRARITPRGIVPEDRLAEALRGYPLVIVPAGALDGRDTNFGSASLSLPGRILFASATSHTPILVVGSERSCGARFVKHFGIGEVAPYEASALSAAMDHLRAPDVQQRMRRNAAAMSACFSGEGVADWLAASIENGTPADGRFEAAFSGYNAAG